MADPYREEAKALWTQRYAPKFVATLTKKAGAADADTPVINVEGMGMVSANQLVEALGAPMVDKVYRKLTKDGWVPKDGFITEISVPISYEEGRALMRKLITQWRQAV